MHVLHGFLYKIKSEEPILPPVVGGNQDSGGGEGQLRSSDAIDLLNRIGARQFLAGGRYTIGLWSAVDTPAVRQVLRVLHPSGAQVLLLEDARVPEKCHAIAPEFLKAASLLNSSGVPYAKWKAGQLNQLFAELGTGKTIRCRTGQAK